MMSKREKLIKKFLAIPIKKDLTFRELRTLFKSLRYEFINADGSRVAFCNKKTGDTFDMHQPHPNDILKVYVVKKVQSKLKEIV
jgi:hypothetical protein